MNEMTIQRPKPVDMRPVMQLAMLADYIIPFAIRAISGLDIADRLSAGPRRVEDLANETDTNPSALYRVLRALASRDVFREVEEGVFALTPMAEVLRSDHPYSLREAFPLLRGDVTSWAEFDHSVRTGLPAFDHVHGQDYWSYLAENPSENTRFNRAMQSFSRIELRAVAPLYDWSRFDQLVDLGGGNGGFLAGLLALNPTLRGVHFDLPHVAAEAQATFEAAGVADRVAIVDGSIFEGVPAGCSGYVIKRVLYDFNDEEALIILRHIRAAMRPDSRLLILDPLAERNGGYEYALSVDLLMMAMVTGYTRTRKQLAELLERAGLRLARVIPTPNFPISEVVVSEDQR